MMMTVFFATGFVISNLLCIILYVTVQITEVIDIGEQKIEDFETYNNVVFL